MAIKSALGFRFKSMSKPDLISSNACFNHSPLLINAVWMQSSGTAVGIYKRSYSPACVSRRTFYEAVRSVTVNLFLPLRQNEISTMPRSMPIFVCLPVLLVQTKLVLALPSQRSSLFILIVSGRGNKSEVSLFNT